MSQYRAATEARYLHGEAQSFESFREPISPFISGTPFVFRNISARCKTWCNAIIHMLNVPRCCRSYTQCAENKRFRLSNFPSLSQLSLSSDVRACPPRAQYTCAALYANNECTGWQQLTPRGTETPTAERQVGRLVGRSVGCSQAFPWNWRVVDSRRAVFSSAKIKTRLHRLNTIRSDKQPLLFPSLRRAWLINFPCRASRSIASFKVMF